MTFSQPVLLVLLSFFLSLLLVPVCRFLAFRTGIVDHPGERKIHKEPVPYLGGISIISGFFLGLVITSLVYNWLPQRELAVIGISTGMILLLGIYDDAQGMMAKVKFSVQITVAVFVVLNGIFLHEIRNPFGEGQIELGSWGMALSVLWIVAISNAVNLLDGLDGLAGGVTGISLLFLAIFAWQVGNLGLLGLILGLLGGIAGFLVFNFPPAKIFMGDAGSLTIGFLMAVFCLMIELRGPATITIFLPALLLTIPIFDTLLAIFRRVKNKQKIFSADKKHLHHRLLELNKSFRKTLYIIYGANFFIGALATLAMFLPPDYRFFLMVILANNLLFAMYTLHLFENRHYWKNQVEEKE